MIQRERDGGKSSQGFNVQIIEPSDYLFNIAKLNTQIDFGRDRRSPSRRISNTGFPNHPVFKRESTTIRSFSPIVNAALFGDEEPAYEFSTFLSLADRFQNNDNSGYFSPEEVLQIRRHLENQSGYEVQSRIMHGAHWINVRVNGLHASLELGYPSRSGREEVLEERRRLSEELYKQIEAQEGSLWEKYKDFWKDVPEKKQTEQEKEEEMETVKAWQENVRAVRSAFPPPSENNEVLHIDMSGIPLKDRDAFVVSVKTYAAFYRDVVNAICSAEGVPAPSEKVLLGSAVFSS